MGKEPIGPNSPGEGPETKNYFNLQNNNLV